MSKAKPKPAVKAVALPGHVGKVSGELVVANMFRAANILEARIKFWPRPQRVTYLSGEEYRR